MLERRVLVGMSGGVDSTAAAIILKNQGYEVSGLFVQTMNDQLQMIDNVKSITSSFGIKLHVVDAKRDSEESVINYFVRAYLAGNTPMPCVVCNSLIKWKFLEEMAKKNWVSRFATGHYAQINSSKDRFYISKATDAGKDQSFFLWGLSQARLRRSLFPLGGFIKKQIFEIVGVCFAKRDYRDFLQKRLGRMDIDLAEGDIVNSDKKVVGRHSGIQNYTVGQKIFISSIQSYKYIKEIDNNAHRIFVCNKEDLFAKELILRSVNWMKIKDYPGKFRARGAIRGKDPLTVCTVYEQKGRYHVVFDKPVFAAAPGQSAVIYDGDDIFIGGVIE
ncbi:MAG: 7-cyano-7-deazaguanine synthase [Bacteroidales bacterium]|nr:7-cyano-7-deazaguanine synthase [Bacteroidales bacterium]